jgi:serine/threonine-protein kinase
MTEITERLSSALADHYRIERELGRGGMATVYLAHDIKHDRDVALKVLRPDLAAGMGPDRFIREIKLAARMTHPHILPLYDSGEADGFFYFVMPLVEGESLRDRIEQSKQLAVEEAVAVAKEVAAALDYAHRHDVVHRDIKPENIMIHDGHAVVADFGIGKAVTAATDDEALTQAGVTVGTPAYMSPEQAAGQGTVDGRSDLYSLGCVLYEMLTGEPPFTGPTVQAVIAKRFVETPPEVTKTRDAVPTHVSQAVSKLMAKTPADRYATGSHVVTVLSAAVAVAPAPAVADKSIAVLPFANMSPDPENEYFSDGIAEEIISALTKSADLRVAARSSAFSFKGKEEDVRIVGQKLGVRTVLEGSVRKSGNRVRVTAQLMNAEDGYQLWSDRYDRQLDDIFEVQDEIARTIAQQLELTLVVDRDEPLVKQHTDNLEAYELYLRGRSSLYQRVARSFENALGYFDRALDLDPNYALAHAGRADVFGLLGFYALAPTTEAMPKARQAAQRALELDDELSEAHAALGIVGSLYDHDWEAADCAYRRAIELNRSNIQARSWYALFHLCWTLGDETAAIEEARAATEIDPLAGYPLALLAYVQANFGLHDDAINSARAAVARDPNSYIGERALALALRWAGDHQGAIRAAERMIQLSGGHSWAVLEHAVALVAAGRESEGQEVLESFLAQQRERVVPWTFVAALHALLGRMDEAYEVLERAFDQRDALLVGLKYWPDFEWLRGDPRFEGVLERVGFP